LVWTATLRWDVSFLGRLYENRLALLESILSELPRDLRLKGRIVGSYRSRIHPIRTVRSVRGRFPLTAQHLHHGQNVAHRYINTLNNESKVCLNLFHEQSTDSLNMRTFETCASGAFLLCQSNPALDVIPGHVIDEGCHG